MAAPGSRSEGFKMRVLPVTVAMGIVHKGIILNTVRVQVDAIKEMMSYAGKLKGAILAQTPSGTFLTNVSMSLLTRGHGVVGIKYSGYPENQ